MDRKMEASMELLKSYCTDSKAIKCHEEEFITIRSCIQRVTATINNSEQKALFCANESYTQTIIYALQVFPDRLTRVFIIKLLFRLFRKSGGKKYAPTLVQKGLTRALFQALYSESAETTPSEEFMLRIHQLLCRIGHLDKRFGVRARVSQCLQITLGLLRAQIALLGTYAPTSALTFSTASTPTNATSPGGQPHNASNSANSANSFNANQTSSSFSAPFLPGGSSAGTNNSVGHVSNPYIGTVITIPTSLNRGLKTVLHTIRLYIVAGAGRMNASILGRSGAIVLLIRLLTLVAGLPSPKLYPGHLSPTISSKSSNTIGNATGSNSSILGQSNQNTSTASSGGQSASNATSTASNSHGTSLSVVLTSASPSLPGFGRNAAENGLVLGSPIVTAVTATASAAAALHRHRLQTTTRRSTKSGAPPNSMSFLASSAASLLSTPPSLLAIGVRYHSKLIRLVLNTLHCLIKWKNNASRAIDAGGIAILLDLFLDVHRCDLHGRRLPLQRSSLACLKCLTVSRTGRKLFINSGGLHTLFAVCAGYVGPDPFGRTGLGISFSTSKASSDSSSLLSTRLSKLRRPGRAAVTHNLLRKTDTSTASTTSVSGYSSAASQKSRSTNSTTQPVELDVNSPYISSTSLASSASLPVAAPSISSKDVVGVSSSAAGDNNTVVHGHNRSIMNKPEEMISILTEACLLLRRCCPRSRLPVPALEGILRCPLPRESSGRTNGEGHVKREATVLQDADRTIPSETRTLKDRSFAPESSLISNVSSTKREEKRTVRLSPKIKETATFERNVRLSSNQYTDDNQSETGCHDEVTETAATSIPSPGRRTEADETISARGPSKRRGVPRKRTLEVTRDPTEIPKKSIEKSAIRRARTKRGKGNHHASIKVQLGSTGNSAIAPPTSNPNGPASKNCSNAPAASSRTRAVRLRRSGSHNSRSTAKPVPYLSEPKDRTKKTSFSTSRSTPVLSTTQSRSHTVVPERPNSSARESSASGRRSPGSISATAEMTSKFHLSDGEPSGYDESPSINPLPPPLTVSSERRSPSPVVLLEAADDDEEDQDDDDDDDGDDDLDDDERNETEDRLDAQPTDPRIILAELVKTHGRFFPEWIDLPQEAPECLTSEGLLSDNDPQAMSWPFFSSIPLTGSIQDHTLSTPKDAVKFDLDDASSDLDAVSQFAPIYLNHARHIQTLIPLQTVAYPDLVGASHAPYVEPFYNRSSDVLLGADASVENRGVHEDTHERQDASDSHLGTESILEDSQASTHLQVPPLDPSRKGLHKAHLDHRPNHSMANGGRRSSTGTSASSQSQRSSASRRISKSTGNLQKLSVVERPPPRLPYSLAGLPHVEILDDVRRLIDPDDLLNRTVFDLDDLIVAALRESVTQQPPALSQHQFLELQSRSGSPRSNILFPSQSAVGSDSDIGGPGTSPAPLANAHSNSSLCASSDPSIQRNFMPGSNGLLPSNVRSTASCGQQTPSVCIYGPDVECTGAYGDCVMTNEDETRISHFDMEKGHLEFESRFESGNLRKAIQVRQYEYDLILNPDVNTVANLQWFYFRVSNVEADVDYRFNIINCEKPSSQFTSGMQPLFFSVREAIEGRSYWRRAGKCVNYYRNHFVRGSHGKRSGDGNTYHTATFVIQFPHTGDVCYLAYHYPYTYTRLLADISRWQEQYNTVQPSSGNRNLYFRVQPLTRTILENPVPVITITDRSSVQNGSVAGLVKQIGELSISEGSGALELPTVAAKKPYIFLTARVHSGESNSSWVMQGLIDRLMSDEEKMVQLRQMFIFKIVPMLNPDGVICGNHRCSMAGKDLNRRWLNPSADIHPTIYHSRKLLQLLHACDRQPYIYIDFHGHSRMKNIFLYGCSPLESWKTPDSHNPAYRSYGRNVEDRSYRHLAELLDTTAPAFAKRSCMYVVNRAKETAARVAVWREFSVVRSYTIEASYCGVTRNLAATGSTSDSDPLANGHQINPGHLGTFGAQLLDVFLRLPAYDLEHPPPPISPPPVLTTGSSGSVPARPSLGEVTPDGAAVGSNEDEAAVDRAKQSKEGLLSPRSDSSDDSVSSLSSVSVSSGFSLSTGSMSSLDNPTDG